MLCSFQELLYNDDLKKGYDLAKVMYMMVRGTRVRSDEDFRRGFNEANRAMKLLDRSRQDGLSADTASSTSSLQLPDMRTTDSSKQRGSAT